MFSIYYSLNFLSLVLFLLSIWGIININNNFIYLLLAIELCFFSISLNLMVSSSLLDDITGQFLVFFILTIAAVESVIGLSIFVVAYRLRGSIDSSLYLALKV